MPVSTLNPDLEYALPDYRLMRDCLNGERVIKARADAYLPRTSGQLAAGLIGDQAYAAYQRRAQFPELVSNTLRGLMGLLWRKPANLVLPSRLAYLEDNATPDALSFTTLARRAAREQLSVGRFAVLVDLPRAGGQPYLVGFDGEALINWRVEDNRLTLAVLRTVEAAGDAEDSFVLKTTTHYRVLRLDQAGYYVQDHYREADGGAPELIEGDIRPTVRGEPLSEIPLVILGSTDITPDPDPIPLLPLARASLALYQLYADYRQSLYMTSQPTPYVTGVAGTDPERPQAIGSTVIWYLQDPQARAGFLEFTGAGISAQRQAIEDEYQRALALGTALIDTRRAAESGEALRLRAAARTATLMDVARALSAGLTRALRFAAAWADADPAEVSFEANTDFVEAGLSAQDLQALVQSWMQGAISHQTLFENLQAGEVISPSRTFEDERELIEQGAPLMPIINEEAA